MSCHHRHCWKSEDMRTVSNYQSASPKDDKAPCLFARNGALLFNSSHPLTYGKRIMAKFRREAITKNVSWQEQAKIDNNVKPPKLKHLCCEQGKITGHARHQTRKPPRLHQRLKKEISSVTDHWFRVLTVS